MTTNNALRNPSVRLTPLAACLALALAAGPIPATATASGYHRHHPNVHPSPWVQNQAHPTLAQRSQKMQEIERAFRAAHAHVAPVPGHIAATIQVTNCADSGAGSFRAAVTAAASGDTVSMSSLACSTITLTTGAISTGIDDLTIVGPGQTALTIDASYSDRAIAHFGYGTLDISGVTVANGYYYGYTNGLGGCIVTNGSITMSQSTVTNCEVTSYNAAFGGGISAYAGGTISDSTISNNIQSYGYGYSSGGGVSTQSGTLTVTNSTVSGNTTSGRGNGTQGGGIYNFGGDTNVIGSTVSGNYSGGVGGGVSGWFGTLTVTNSTVSGNYAYAAGGGVSSLLGSMALSNNTISSNSAGYYGGGVYAKADVGGSTFNSTIIFGNTAPTGNDTNAYPPATATGANNLIGSSDGTFTAPGDTISSDPLLQALANNGGPTMTQMLGAGSPAIDVGNNAAGLTFDQRGTGFPRVNGAAPDIGAFERAAAVAGPPRIPVPALSTWALGLMAGLLGLLGWRREIIAITTRKHR
ncbi:MAG TPA: IPTL-CTERM sorting domain-containing protein [Rudaea sp.]|nr:IPTL-CTERM sorting domain-containing protein [Rudaea sp.]